MTAVENLTGRVLARYAGAALVGVLIGVIGTSIHRSRPPLGLALALLIVLVAGVLARAWAGAPAMLTLAMGIATSVAVLGAGGPGGDVLIAADPLGYVWYGGAAVVALAALAPRRWFSDRPLGPTPG
ncbi:MAG: hypothetical protein JWP95_2192 [Actinotalea sp.]|nr:hypothetical protein [Actinotalea sp.]